MVESRRGRSICRASSSFRRRRDRRSARSSRVGDEGRRCRARARRARSRSQLAPTSRSLDGSDRWWAVIERRVLGRGRCSPSATSPLRAHTARSRTRRASARNTSRPACRAAPRTRWRPCSAKPAARCCSTAVRSKSKRSHSPTSYACWWCIPAFRGHSKARRTRNDARREHRSGDALGLRALRDATFEQVRDEPRGRHAVTEMARVRAFAKRSATTTPTCSVRSCSRVTRRLATTWTCPLPSSTRSWTA